MELIQETKLYNLSTRSTACTVLNGDYKSSCYFQIPDLLVHDEFIEYISFSVPYAAIPVSFYIVNETNCRLDVSVGGVTTKYSFPYGNYNATSFISQFTTTMGTGWSISLNQVTSRFTISNTINDFSLLNTSTISSVMGFSSTCSSSSKLIILPRTCNFLPLPRVNLRCAELANTVMVGGTFSTADVIISIPNNAKPNGQIYYQNSSDAKLLFRKRELSSFTVRFTDDDNNLINFNGISSFFTLQFDIYRRLPPKLPMFGNIVEYVNTVRNRNMLEVPADYMEENL